MSDIRPVVRVAGVGRPLPLVTLTGDVSGGRYRGSDFVKFDAVLAEGLDLHGLRFEYLATEGSTFVDCDFSGVRIRSGSLDASRTTTFVRCRFDRLQPGATIWGPSRFESCSFAGMRLKDWRPKAAEFVGCTFSGRFDGIVLSGTPSPPWDSPDRLVPWRTRNEFHGNDFSGADIRFPDFRWGVELAANRWPVGPEYLYVDDWPRRLAAATAEVATWEDDAQRERALWWLRFEREAGRDRQQQVLIRRTDWDLPPANTWPRLWAALESAHW